MKPQAATIIKLACVRSTTAPLSNGVTTFNDCQLNEWSQKHKQGFALWVMDTQGAHPDETHPFYATWGILTGWAKMQPKCQMTSEQTRAALNF